MATETETKGGRRPVALCGQRWEYLDTLPWPSDEKNFGNGRIRKSGKNSDNELVPSLIPASRHHVLKFTVSNAVLCSTQMTVEVDSDSPSCCAAATSTDAAIWVTSSRSTARPRTASVRHCDRIIP